ncbi:MAG: trimethylamine methyltransferase family protein, partial [Desulfobacteraceae bacterium]|nr:trimethylamine methyltransferase family protein [Desulfobacteraceae bacterium]
IGVQATAEITHQLFLSALTGADFVHNVGLAYHATVISPELIVLSNEIIDMVKVLMSGIELNDETIPFDMVERLGPKSIYLTEDHTLKHYHKFWTAPLFDRTFTKKDGNKDCEELLTEKTIGILATHEPKPLPEEIVKELKKMEKTWFDRVGLKHEYPKRS